MKSEDIINEVDLTDAKRIIIFVEKKDGGQIAEWEAGNHFGVSSARTRQNLKSYVRFMLGILHRWLMEDIPDFPLKPEKKSK